MNVSLHYHPRPPPVNDGFYLVTCNLKRCEEPKRLHFLFSVLRREGFNYPAASLAQASNGVIRVAPLRRLPNVCQVILQQQCLYTSTHSHTHTYTLLQILTFSL